jgi:hypothetical protein
MGQGMGKGDDRGQGAPDAAPLGEDVVALLGVRLDELNEVVLVVIRLDVGLVERHAAPHRDA